MDLSFLRIGVVQYTNALPLECHLSCVVPQADIVRGTPSSLAGQLERGDLDVALVSSIELLRHPEYGFVPGLGICSDGPVRSVCLFSKKSPADVESVALDRSSLTSVTMIRILYREYWKREPEYIPFEPPVENGLRIADAALSIGDPTLQFDGAGLHVLDMGDLWRRFCNRPFVYAVWVTRKGLDPTPLVDPFERALEKSRSNIGELADRCSRESPLSRDFYIDYFTNCIHYRMDERDLDGMHFFFDRAKSLI